MFDVKDVIVERVCSDCGDEFSVKVPLTVWTAWSNPRNAADLRWAESIMGEDGLTLSSKLCPACTEDILMFQTEDDHDGVQGFICDCDDGESM